MLRMFIVCVAGILAKMDLAETAFNEYHWNLYVERAFTGRIYVQNPLLL